MSANLLLGIVVAAHDGEHGAGLLEGEGGQRLRHQSRARAVRNAVHHLQIGHIHLLIKKRMNKLNVFVHPLVSSVFKMSPPPAPYFPVHPPVSLSVD
jgi:hypothetical protein